MVELDQARVVYSFLKGSFENSGYSVFMGGSTLVYGQGNDLDILFLRKADRALSPKAVLDRLEGMGFEATIIEQEENEFGFMGMLNGVLVDILVLGWTGKEKI